MVSWVVGSRSLWLLSEQGVCLRILFLWPSPWSSTHPLSLSLFLSLSRKKEINKEKEREKERKERHKKCKKAEKYIKNPPPPHYPTPERQDRMSGESSNRKAEMWAERVRRPSLVWPLALQGCPWRGKAGFGRSVALLTPWFWPLTSRTVRVYISVVWCHQDLWSCVTATLT